MVYILAHFHNCHKSNWGLDNNYANLSLLEL